VQNTQSSQKITWLTVTKLNVTTIKNNTNNTSAYMKTTNMN